MTDSAANFELTRQHIFKMWSAETAQDKAMLEAMVFVTGQDFLDCGSLPLNDCFDFYRAGFLFFDTVEISPYVDEFDVIDLSPDFKAACNHYQRPNDFSPRGVIADGYEEAHGFDSDDDEIDFDDYRRGDVYYLSETKLRSELTSRDKNWITYRTPYRPETEDELRRPL